MGYSTQRGDQWQTGLWPLEYCILNTVFLFSTKKSMSFSLNPQDRYNMGQNKNFVAIRFAHLCREEYSRQTGNTTFKKRACLSEEINSSLYSVMESLCDGMQNTISNFSWAVDNKILQKEAAKMTNYYIHSFKSANCVSKCYKKILKSKIQVTGILNWIL